MKILRLSDHAKYLSSRRLGAALRAEIVTSFEMNIQVEIRFEGVEGMSHSFADECFGVLAEAFGIGPFRNMIRFAGVRTEDQQLIRSVVAERIAGSKKAG